MRYKLTIILLLLTLIFLVGCSSNSNISSIDHIHGSGYSSDGTVIYIATHEGLIQSSDEGKTWTKVTNEEIDFMGYQYVSDKLMISSGHPGKGSKLPEPVGFIRSEDQGKTWESISLAGKVDFHLLAMRNEDANTIYGVTQMDVDEYPAGLYKSIDGGLTWNRLDAQGLPMDLHEVISLTVSPTGGNHLFAGSSNGLLESTDGGQTWVNIDSNRVITAMQFLPEIQDRMISYSITAENKGVMTSNDLGRTWGYLGLDLGKDAVSYFSISSKNPEVILASTFETSVFLSKDGGKNWDQLLDKGKVIK